MYVQCTDLLTIGE